MNLIVRKLEGARVGEDMKAIIVIIISISMIIISISMIITVIIIR